MLVSAERCRWTTIESQVVAESSSSVNFGNGEMVGVFRYTSATSFKRSGSCKKTIRVSRSPRITTFDLPVYFGGRVKTD
jgi:hypothetical protein